MNRPWRVVRARFQPCRPRAAIAFPLSRIPNGAFHRAARDARQPTNRNAAVRHGIADAQERWLVFDEQATEVGVSALGALGLSDREAEVLAWVVKGKTNADIASILVMNVRTVQKHVERILAKLGVETRTAAARVAMENVRLSWRAPARRTNLPSAPA